MIYFNSRHLSNTLSINVAKWKRWAREFLPPDPLGGLQSGYARQFNYKDAFRVYLGGQLVSVLRFSIPETRNILNNLDAALKKHGFYELNPQKETSQFQDHWLLIDSPSDGKYQCSIQAQANVCLDSKALFGRLLNVSKLYREFLGAVSK